jgi:hypothetical protein
MRKKLMWQQDFILTEYDECECKLDSISVRDGRCKQTAFYP